MGGLWKRLPVVFCSFLIGSAALSALPFTSGFYSKDAILLSAWTVPGIGPWLFAGGLLGALLTSIYSFRLVFIVFFGAAHTEPDRQPGWRMAVPLVLLCVLALVGGWIALPLSGVLPAEGHAAVSHTVKYLGIGTPLLGLAIAYLLFLGRQISIASLLAAPAGRALQAFWYSGAGIDKLYDALWVRPFNHLAHWCRNEPVDLLYNALVGLTRWGHGRLVALQTGELRWYATSMVFGLLLLLAIMLRDAS